MATACRHPDDTENMVRLLPTAVAGCLLAVCAHGVSSILADKGNYRQRGETGGLPLHETE